MLTLVIPACLTASITVAKAPKGTSSSARTKTDWPSGSRFFPQLRADLIDVDGIVAQKYLLLAVDGDHQTLLGDLFHRLGVRHGHFDAGLQHGRSHHEDDEQYQYDVHQRCDVDVGE